jgi:leucyl aminopeptidase (aminopeptidase T)
MKSSIPYTIFVSPALVLISFTALFSEDSGTTSTRAESTMLAKKLLVDCARVREGDIVRIEGGIGDVELIENLGIEAAKLGADPLTVLFPSDNAIKRYQLEVPAKYDTRTSPIALKLAEMLDVSVFIESFDYETSFAGLPPERVNALFQSMVLNVDQAMLANNVRRISLGNGFYPTERRARRLGITLAELSKLFHDGLNVDYDTLRATGETIRNTLATAKVARLTSTAGTNLSVRIENRPAHVSDGVLSDEEIKKGGAACLLFLPAGEVYLTPVAGTAEGTVIIDRQLWEGKEVRNLKLTFKAGRLTSMSADSEIERLKEVYDAAGAGKDEFSALDVGINPAVRLPDHSPGDLFVQSGMITIGLGNNEWAGGENTASFGLSVFLRTATLRIDDQFVVQDGALKVQ